MFQKYVLMIYIFMYMNIKVCSYFDFVISGLVDWYMIFQGLEQEYQSTPAYFTKF